MPNWLNIIKPERLASNMWRPSTWMNMSDWIELIKSPIIISCSITFSRWDFSMSSHIIINLSYILESNFLNYFTILSSILELLQNFWQEWHIYFLRSWIWLFLSSTYNFKVISLFSFSILTLIPRIATSWMEMLLIWWKSVRSMSEKSAKLVALNYLLVALVLTVTLHLTSRVPPWSQGQELKPWIRKQLLLMQDSLVVIYLK